MMGCNGIVVVGGGKYIIGGITGCKGIVVVGRLGIFIPTCGEIEGGMWDNDVVGNISCGVGSLAFFALSSSNRCCKLLKSDF